ncbi:MAG: energy-coupling factor transporter transmembrane protein EcfT [Lachnospiraceae bacterium]|nr:energy-coupling factor transporter transmembrane protein EcfT [Lachnospiraceae bacterium]
MLRDITIGQYYQADSVMHRLDPRTKIVLTFVYILSLFIFENPAVYSVAALFLIIEIILSKVPVLYMVRGLKPVVFLLAFTVVVNMFFTGGQELFSFWIFRITIEGIKRSAYLVGRIVFLVLASNLMTLTTAPVSLTNALEYLMKPLKLLRVPVHEVAMMMSIALRFIPILVDETNKIMKAQIARGADFESGNIIKKTKSFVPIIIPLFVSAFRRANNLAQAMEARCYNGGEGRTRLNPLKYKRGDIVAYVLLVIYAVLIVLMGCFLFKAPPVAL